MVKFLLVVGLFSLVLGAICLVSIKIGVRGKLDRAVEFAAWLVTLALFAVIILLASKGPASAQLNDALERILNWLRK